MALSADVPAGTVIPAWTPQGDIALWRSQSGSLSASSDRCPHRGMRLSHGFVRDEMLSCIYHGWSYDHKGHCRRIPAHPDLTPPATINTRNQIVEERNGVVWIANQAQETPPPAFDRHAPLRSMTVSAGIAALVNVAGGKADDNGSMTCTLGGETVTLLAVEQAPATTLVHILVGGTTSVASRIAVSRAAEQLRRDAEAIQIEEVAI